MRQVQRVLGVMALLVAQGGLGAAQAPRPAQRPTPAAKPAPPGRQTLAAKAKQVCEDAQTLPTTAGVAVGPAMSLLKADGASDWAYEEALQVPQGALPATAVKAIVCIKETLIPDTRKYDDGASALARRWDVRVVSWPEGRMLRSRRLSEPPPYSKRGFGPGVGERPIKELSLLLDHPSIVAHLQAPAGDISTQVALSEDLSLFAATDGKVVTVFDVAAGQPKGRFEASVADYWYVGEMALSPDAKSLVTAVSEKKKKYESSAKYLAKWDVAAGKEAVAFQGGLDNSAQRIAYSPDGRFVASMGLTRSDVKLWDAVTGKELRVLRGHSEWVHDVVFSADSQTLITASRDKTVRLWDVATGAAQKTLEAGSNIYAVAVSADGKRLASAHGGGYTTTSRGLVILWDTATSSRLRELQHEAEALAVSFSPDGRLLATGAGDGVLRIFDSSTGRELASLSGHQGSVKLLRFSADGSRLFSSGRDAALKTWDVTGATAPKR